MKLLLAFVAFLLGAAMGITPSERGDPGDKGIITEIRSCKDLVGNTFEGTMIFTTAITCANPKVWITIVAWSSLSRACTEDTSCDDVVILPQDPLKNTDSRQT